MKKISYALVMMLLIGACKAQKPAIVTSDETGWHKIGELKIDFEKDTSALEVIGADAFSSLIFKATTASLNIQDIIVHFENDSNQVIRFRQTLKPGEQSSVLKLKGGEPALRRISVVCKTMPNRKEEKGVVEVMGLKTNRDKK